MRVKNSYLKRRNIISIFLLEVPEYTFSVRCSLSSERHLKLDTAGFEALAPVRRDTWLRLTMWTEVVKMSARRMKSSQL